MRVVVTGRNGQVATALREIAPDRGADVVSLGRPELDLTAPDGVARALEAARPDVVVGAAAYTAVDQAESEPDAAFAVNAHGAGVLARTAARLGVPIVHLSTDYVFDGSLDRPYREDDPVGPTSVYGRSKLEGEREVSAAHADHAILRTAWVFAPFGKNFVRTMLRLAASRERVGIVADQYGSPTAAHEIAEGVLKVARTLLAEPGRSDLRGVFHMTCGGYCSWADLAEHVFATSRALGGPTAGVDRIPTSAYPTLARRPANSRLDTSRLRDVHGVSLAEWRAPVAACVERLVREQKEEAER